MEQEKAVAAGTGRKKVWYGLLGMVAVLLVVAGGYFFYWTKTPEYALKQLQAAVLKQDAAAVQRQVDREALFGKIFDDLVDGALVKDKNVDEGTKARIGALAEQFRPVFITALAEMSGNFVQRGSWQLESAEKRQEYGRLPPIAAPQALIDRAGLATSEFRGAAKISQTDKTAIFAVKVFEKLAAQEFSVQVRMEKAAAGHWQLVEIIDLPGYLEGVRQARQVRLRELNQPIEAEMNRALLLGEVRLRKIAKNGWSFASSLEATIPVVYRAEVPVAEWEGDLLVKDHAGQTLFVGAVAVPANSGRSKGQSETLRYSFELNSYFPGQGTVLRAAAGELKTEVAVRRVRFADGKELKLWNKLPE